MARSGSQVLSASVLSPDCHVPVRGSLTEHHRAGGAFVCPLQMWFCLVGVQAAGSSERGPVGRGSRPCALRPPCEGGLCGRGDLHKLARGFQTTPSSSLGSLPAKGRSG